MGKEFTFSVQAFRMVPAVRTEAVLVHDGPEPITVIVLGLDDENMISLVESEYVQKTIGAAFARKAQDLLLKDSAK